MFEQWTASEWMAALTALGTLAGVGAVFFQLRQLSRQIFKVSASTAVDALLAYTKDSYRLALNVTNIADTRYVAACYGYTSCFYAEGREAIAKLTYRW